MTCCICGEDLGDEDLVLRLSVYKFRSDGPNYTLLARKFEDGSHERLAHLTCPVNAGAPMSLIGADGENFDG